MRFSKPTIISFALHAGTIGGIIWITGQIQQPSPIPVNHQAIEIGRYLPLVGPPENSGGGGGGDLSPLPASFGNLPKAVPKPFVPPSVKTFNDAVLLVEPAIYSPVEVDIPRIAGVTVWGNPNALAGPPSNGPGRGGGIGEGCCGGVGNNRGGGHGDEPGPGLSGFKGAFRIGRDTSSPVLLYGPEPEYSEEARKAKFNGTVRLNIIVGEDGKAAAIEVTGPLGLGLDEKAIEAVKRWRFKPGYNGGKAVKVFAQVEVNFRIL